jgi:DNA-binding LacI/PurR family transcriptional regulator
MVLNNQTSGRVPISEATRRRVLQAARQLGYSPNPVAQMLAQGSSHLIGVFTYEPVFPYDKTDFYFPYLFGIEYEACQQDCNVLLFTRHRQPVPQIYQNGMNTLRLADGSVLLGSKPDRDELRQLTEEGYPFVFIGRREIPGCELYWVANDYRVGSYEALRHLLDLGHRAVGFIGNEIDLEPQRDKLVGCEYALDETPGVSFTILHPHQFQTIPALAQAIRDGGITAVISPDNTHFHTALRCAHEMGWQVPDDLSVVSLTTVENSLPFSLRPTYVKLNRHQLGSLAVQMLSQRISGLLTRPEHIYVPCGLVVGETTSSPRSHRRLL